MKVVFLSVIAIMLMNLPASHLQAREQQPKAVNISMTHIGKLESMQVWQWQWIITFKDNISAKEKSQSVAEIQQFLAKYFAQNLPTYSYTISFVYNLDKEVEGTMQAKMVVNIYEGKAGGGAVPRVGPNPPGPPIIPPGRYYSTQRV